MKTEEKRAQKDTAEEDGKKSAVRENVEAILVAVLLALLIRTFIVQAFKIPSGSMIPTLRVGDHILVNKFVYGLDIPFLNIPVYPGDTPQRGDIIVFKYPEDPDKDFIKRVIGVGGDIVAMKGRDVYVNGHRMTEDYAIYQETRGRRGGMAPVKVPPGKLFVMGDNRDNSHDSRFWGFVDLQAVRGKAFIIYWSWNSGAASPLDYVRWGRLGDVLH
ncbi:MAG: signal peptidase I [Thermodesulfobacteriota bacterium]|nr:signal peptidase I [Thermodesulfobacteriota bacterium]